MAQRRMFSQRITNSARFLKMSQSAQALYFHLGMRADDDGIVEAYTVMQVVNAAEDDFKVLVVKGFIRPLNEDLVSYILDWSEHNLIRADRKVDSIYKDLLLQIVPEAELVEPKPRADTGKTTGRPVDDQWTTNGQHRLGKVRLGEVSTGKANTSTKVEGEPLDKRNPDIQTLWEYGLTLGFSSTKQNLNRFALKRMLSNKTVDQLKKAASFSQEIRSEQYAPQVNNWLDLEDKYLKLRDFVQRHNKKTTEKKERTLIL